MRPGNPALISDSAAQPIPIDGDGVRENMKSRFCGNHPLAVMLAALALLACSAPARGTVTGESSPGAIHIVHEPPRLMARVTLSEPSGNNVLDAEETGQLVVSVTNSGKGDSCGLAAALIVPGANGHLSFEKEIEFGFIPAGQTVKRMVAMGAHRDIESTQLTLQVNFREDCGFEPDPVKLTFHTHTLLPPMLELVDVGIDDFDQDGLIEPGEVVDVTLRVQNRGQGAAMGVHALVSTGENVFLTPDSSTDTVLGALQRGEFQDVRISFFINRRIADGADIPIQLKVTEERGRYGFIENPPLRANVPQKRIREMVLRPLPAASEYVDVPPRENLSVDVELDVPVTGMTRPHGVAVLIGNSLYADPDMPEVSFAVRDAQIMRRYLIDTLGYPEENIIMAHNATLAVFREIFGSENDYKGKLHHYIKAGESDVFVYYSGHGAPDINRGTPYFVPSDGDPDYVSHTGYPLELFFRNLSLLDARSITVALDTCFSGGSGGGFLISEASPMAVEVEQAGHALTAVRPDAAVFSCGGDMQICSWYAEKKHGLFTYFFLKGLNGAADANGDRKITADELHAFIADADNGVPHLARLLFGREQTPRLEGRGDMVLVRF